MEEQSESSGAAALFELRGREPGSAHSLSDRVFRIGSDEDNDLRLDDSGVALFQAEVHCAQEQFVIKNLSLEGAAFLNGSSFEETTLHKGDILSVGDSMFRFVEAGETLTQDELWRPVGGKDSVLGPSKSQLRRFSYLAFLILIAVGVVMVVILAQQNDEEIIWKDGNKPITTKRAVDRKELLFHYDRGKALMVARRWDEAIVFFDKIRDEIPNFKDTENLYRKSLVESHYLDLLNQGKGLCIESELAQAKRELQSIPEDSVYFRETERLIREVDDNILGLRLDEASQYLVKKDWIAARREAEAILAKYPNNKRAHDILKNSKSLQRISANSRLSKTWFDEDWTKKGRNTTRSSTLSRSRGAARVVASPGNQLIPRNSPVELSSAAPAKPETKATKRVWKPRPPLQRALSAYLEGDAEKSLSFLEPLLEPDSAGEKGERALKAERMRNNLVSAESLCKQAVKLQDESRYSEALELWEKFLEKDLAISGKKTSANLRKASGFLGQIYYDRGKKAFDNDDLPESYLFWNMAKKIQPGNRDVKKGLGELSKKARRLYRDGYSLQDVNPDEAVRKWEEVLKIVPSGDPYYVKAKKQIKRQAVLP